MAGATDTRITPSNLPKGRDAGPGFSVRLGLWVRLPGEVLSFSHRGIQAVTQETLPGSEAKGQTLRAPPPPSSG